MRLRLVRGCRARAATPRASGGRTAGARSRIPRARVSETRARRRKTSGETRPSVPAWVRTGSSRVGSRRWVTDLRSGLGARTGRVRTTPRRTPADDNRGPASREDDRSAFASFASAIASPRGCARGRRLPSSAVPTPCNVVVAPARAGALPSAGALSPSTARRIRRSRPRAALRPVDPRWRAETPAPPSAAVLESRQLVLPQRGPPSARAHPPSRGFAPTACTPARAPSRAPTGRARSASSSDTSTARSPTIPPEGAPQPAEARRRRLRRGGVWRARPQSIDGTVDRAPSFAPHEVFDNLRLLAQHFVRYRQEDAHELLRLTLDAMDRSCLVNCGRPPVGGGSLDPANPARAMPPTVVERVFQGRFRNRVTCVMRPGQRRARSVLDVSLELARGVGSVDEAFDAFVAEETLEGENAYECERCGGLRPATKRLTVRGARGVGGAPQTLRSLGRKNRRALSRSRTSSPSEVE